jgi:polar amino acid transport system substrate-binding protein
MKYWFSFILPFLLLTFTVTVRADTIVLAADPWCPYNCEPNTKQEGYLIDIARAVFEKAGHRVEYKTTNWARAIADAKEGKINGVVGAVPDEVPDFILTKEPLGSSQDHFYVLPKNPWRYQNTSSLSTIKLGVINGYAYNADILNFIKANKKSPMLHIASGEHALKNNINMVMQGRLDTLIENKDVYDMTINKMGVTNQLMDAGSSGAATPIYIAFSPIDPHSQEYADLLSVGIIELRKTGELQKILAKYGLAGRSL